MLSSPIARPFDVLYDLGIRCVHDCSSHDMRDLSFVSARIISWPYLLKIIGFCVLLYAHKLAVAELSNYAHGIAKLGDGKVQKNSKVCSQRTKSKDIHIPPT